MLITIPYTVWLHFYFFWSHITMELSIFFSEIYEHLVIYEKDNVNEVIRPQQPFILAKK